MLLMHIENHCFSHSYNELEAMQTISVSSPIYHILAHINATSLVLQCGPGVSGSSIDTGDL